MFEHKLKLDWKISLAMWLAVLSLMFIAAVEGFSLYVWLLENPGWLL